MYLTITVSTQILDFEIRTKGASRIIRRFFRSFDHHFQIEYAVLKNRIGLTYYSIYSCLLIRANSYRDYRSTLENHQGNLFKSLLGKNMRIIDYDTAWSKFRLDRFIFIISFSDIVALTVILEERPNLSLIS